MDSAPCHSGLQQTRIKTRAKDDLACRFPRTERKVPYENTLQFYPVSFRETSYLSEVLWDN